MFKRYFDFINENRDIKLSIKKSIEEICVAMVLINNEFLDNLLDRGLKARYSENSEVFINDLKILLSSKNRLNLGRFDDGKCIEDEDLSKITNALIGEFDIEKDWNKLISARNMARSIIDKLLAEKLTTEMIAKVYWIGPNKDEDHKEDIVIELNTGKQYPIFLGKSPNTQRTTAFSTFASELISEDMDSLFDTENIRKWDKLVQEFIRITYENSNKNIQRHIEKFIDSKRIDSVGYFDFFSIRHSDQRFKYLGEFIKEFDKNILMLVDLLNNIWKNPEVHFSTPEKAMKNWYGVKKVVLNSRILERLFTTSLRIRKSTEIKKIKDGYKNATGSVKMRLIKLLVEKLGCQERDVFYLSTGGELIRIPSKNFFRKYFHELDVDFDYHVKFTTEEDENDFNMKVRIRKGDKELLNFKVFIIFTGGEVSSKLSAKYKFILPNSFNHLMIKIEGKEDVY